MPNYKTHSIHGELLFDRITKQIDIDLEDFKLYCMGPDAIILTDYKIAAYQHAHKTKQYFLYLIKTIKNKKLYNNKEVMAFLYGQLDHFILDSVMHPLIYYMTERLNFDHKIKPHGLVENWIDDYTTQKHDKKQKLYYKKWFNTSKKLKELIDKVYEKVYRSKHEGLKYNFGTFATIIFDSLARTNVIKITPFVIKSINLGDFTYQKDIERVLPYLNLKKETWYNPETGEQYNFSFDELWEKSLDIAQEAIEDVNRYLYDDKDLTNEFILNNTSYNTGLPCSKGQTLRYVKKYEK